MGAFVFLLLGFCLFLCYCFCSFVNDSFVSLLFGVLCFDACCVSLLVGFCDFFFIAIVYFVVWVLCIFFDGCCF